MKENIKHLDPSKKKLLVLISVIFIAACFLSSCRRQVVARVDVSNISVKDVVQTIKIEKTKFDPILLKTSKNSNAFKQQVLENLIQEQILLNEARRRGIKITKAELENAIKDISNEKLLEEQKIDPQLWKKKQENRLIIKKLVDKEVKEKIHIGQDEIASYYKNHQKDFYQPVQYHARQIVVDNKALANEILKKIKNGEDFAELAQRYSLSPDRKRGGDLGFFNANTFPSIFAKICSRLKPGEISDVIATDYGFQIFELIEKRPPHQLSLEEAMPEIKRILNEKKLENAFEKWFKELRNKARITINQEELEKIDVD